MLLSACHFCMLRISFQDYEHTPGLLININTLLLQMFTLYCIHFCILHYYYYRMMNIDEASRSISNNKHSSNQL